MRISKKKPKAYRSLAWRIGIFISALWLICMGILTWCVASDFQIQVKDQLENCVNLYGWDRDRGNNPGHAMINTLDYPYHSLSIDPLLPIVGDPRLADTLSSDDWLWGRWSMIHGYEPAVIYYDEENNILMQSGDYLTFTYTSESNWAKSDTTPTGKSYIALDKIPGGNEFADRYISDTYIMQRPVYWFLPVLRLTGYFEEDQFFPTSVDSVDNFHRLNETDPYFYANADAQNDITWKNLLAAPSQSNKDLVTIYAWDAYGFNYTGNEVTAKGETFPTLAALLHQNTLSGHFSQYDADSYQKESIIESVYINYRTKQDDYGSFQIAVAIRCYPLQYACLRLGYVYLCSFLIVFLSLWFMLRSIKKHFAFPVDRMLQSALKGKVIIPCAKYTEIYNLEQHFSETHQTLFENKAEIQRLSTALDYAHEAEEKRKQLISDITHELKTPLAVIHSYAECLQEDIPEEKQEQYLQTIMEQTERMDAMVVQMLDLSRLEAGKVHLSSDQFSLLGLTKTIAEKMELLFEERHLTLQYHWAQDFTITADEARMEQAITNLLSNAQKYTTEGGTVRIKTRLSNRNVHFYIENTAEHLSKDALEKVWDSFYRVDASRNTAGTGLGLSIVKSIIALHGGSCVVRNTWINDEIRAVEFGFILPLK